MLVLCMPPAALVITAVTANRPMANATGARLRWLSASGVYAIITTRPGYRAPSAQTSAQSPAFKKSVEILGFEPKT